MTSKSTSDFAIVNGVKPCKGLVQWRKSAAFRRSAMLKVSNLEYLSIYKEIIPGLAVYWRVTALLDLENEGVPETESPKLYKLLL